MNFINYFLASIISISGLMIGVILMALAPEEKKMAKKYFPITGKISIAILAAIFLFLKTDYILIIFSVALCAFILFAEFKSESKWLQLSLLGIIFYISSETVMFAAVSSMVFFYSISVSGKTRVPEALLFLAVSNILYFCFI